MKEEFEVGDLVTPIAGNLWIMVKKSFPKNKYPVGGEILKISDITIESRPLLSFEGKPYSNKLSIDGFRKCSLEEEMVYTYNVIDKLINNYEERALYTESRGYCHYEGDNN